MIQAFGRVFAVPRRPRAAPMLAAGMLALAASQALALDIVFDYRFDRHGFFDPATVAGAQRRSVLEAAASVYEPLSDALAPIDPGGSFGSWRVAFRHPSWNTFFEQAVVEDLTVAANTFVVFVGASVSQSSVLGMAENGTITVTGGGTAFETLVHTRGQAGALGPQPSDVGPWGGSMWFNSFASWHTGLDTAGLDTTKADMLTTVTHEIGHLLGIGEAASWQSLVEGTSGNYRFTGAAVRALYGGDLPLDAIGAHFAEGVMSTVDGVVQETLMDPTTTRGTRELMTALDYAALADIGWQVSPVPEPATNALLAVGALLLGARLRRRKD